ncbi:MAG: thioredoxin family protein [Marinobacter sp.]|nr:thioredoxin family protein [Marinobacter sp.]
MGFTSKYTAEAPELQEVQQTRGPLVLEFGTSWCGHCRAAQPHIEEAFTSRAEIPHWKIEDGKGRRLGRAFRVKLWPTLILLRDGQEVERLVRPTDTPSIARALGRI